MKLIIGLIILSVIGIFLLNSCKSCGKNGNGHVVMQNRSVSSFNKISVEGVFPVELSQDGTNEFVKVEADENLQDYIIVTNEGDKVVVKFTEQGSIYASKKMKVYINIKKLTELEFKSVGSLTTANTLILDTLELNSESVGKLHLDIEANFLRANLSSVGATTLKGKVNEVRINNKSVGTLSAYDLKAGTLMIHNTAIGTAEIYADSAFYLLHFANSLATQLFYHTRSFIIKCADG